MVGATVVTGFGALPAHASLPLTFSHMVGLPRHDAPVDVAVDGAGDVYVTDLGGTSSNDRIVKYDPNGIFLDVLAGYGSNPGDIVNPTSITIAPNGNIYVVENGAASSLANEISYYDSGGAFLGSWGAYGIGNGQFKNPLDIAIDSVGNVYIADNVNDRIQKFASNGVWLNSWAVNNPTGVAVDGLRHGLGRDGEHGQVVQHLGGAARLVRVYQRIQRRGRTYRRPLGLRVFGPRAPVRHNRRPSRDARIGPADLAAGAGHAERWHAVRGRYGRRPDRAVRNTLEGDVVGGDRRHGSVDQRWFDRRCSRRLDGGELQHRRGGRHVVGIVRRARCDDRRIREPLGLVDG